MLNASYKKSIREKMLRVYCLISKEKSLKNMINFHKNHANIIDSYIILLLMITNLYGMIIQIFSVKFYSIFLLLKLFILEICLFIIRRDLIHWNTEGISINLVNRIVL